MCAPHHALVADRPRSRRGISVLEVLISMFVMLFGLMYVFSLIPVGRHEMIEASKQERATCAATAGLREMKIRGVLDTRTWINPHPFPNGVTYAIDPLGVLQGPTSASTFPIGANSPTGATLPGMARINLGWYSTPGPPPPTAYTLAMADEIFRCQDDLIFNLPANADLPAEQQYTNTDKKRTSEGSYSWMATLVPTNTPNSYTVSVVVFYQRNLIDASLRERVVGLLSAGSIALRDIPTTPFVTQAFPGLGVTGGEVTLQTTATAAGTLTADQVANETLGVKTGEWLMLAGEETGDPLSRAYKWYRVAGTEGAARKLTGPGAPADTYVRQVTLAGPDWPFAAAGAGITVKPGTSTQAWLFEGVIAVYEKTMRLEVPSAWNSY